MDVGITENIRFLNSQNRKECTLFWIYEIEKNARFFGYLKCNTRFFGYLTSKRMHDFGIEKKARFFGYLEWKRMHAYRKECTIFGHLASKRKHAFWTQSEQFVRFSTQSEQLKSKI